MPMTNTLAKTEYEMGYAWGLTEGMHAIPENSLESEAPHHAAAAHEQCEDAGMSEMYCQGAHDAVLQGTGWSESRNAERYYS